MDVIKPSQQRTDRGLAGFTLIEMMIVVVMIGVLASIAIVSFRKYIARARTTEAVAMLAEMSAKEQLYYVEFASYLPLRSETTVSWAGDEAGAAFHPSNPTTTTFDSVRTPSDLGTFPMEWRYVGLRPKQSQVYCTYMGNAGAAGQAINGSSTVGAKLVTNTATPWFYVMGVCNLNGASGFPTGAAIFGMSSMRSTMLKLNEDQ